VLALLLLLLLLAQAQVLMRQLPHHDPMRGQILRPVLLQCLKLLHLLQLR
jgi:hypothetical protein